MQREQLGWPVRVSAWALRRGPPLEDTTSPKLDLNRPRRKIWLQIITRVTSTSATRQSALKNSIGKAPLLAKASGARQVSLGARQVSSGARQVTRLAPDK